MKNVTRNISKNSIEIFIILIDYKIAHKEVTIYNQIRQLRVDIAFAGRGLTAILPFPTFRVTTKVVKGIIPDRNLYPHPNFLPIFCLNLRKNGK
jgi:hypothetical protein